MSNLIPFHIHSAGIFYHFFWWMGWQEPGKDG